MQRLVIHKVVDFKGSRIITDTLWMLMEAGIEEVKILQTITLLLTSSHVVQVGGRLESTKRVLYLLPMRYFSHPLPARHPRQEPRDLLQT